MHIKTKLLFWKFTDFLTVFKTPRLKKIVGKESKLFSTRKQLNEKFCERIPSLIKILI